jgi:hypothetical protein
MLIKARVLQETAWLSQVVEFQRMAFQVIRFQIGVFKVVAHFVFVNTATWLVLFPTRVLLRVATRGTLRCACLLVVISTCHGVSVAGGWLRLLHVLLLVPVLTIDSDAIFVGHLGSP